MMKQYFENVVSGIETKLMENPESKSPRKLYALEVAKIGSRLYSGAERISWCGITAPFDLLSAMDVTSCFVEFVGAMLASTGVAGDFIETAEHAGFAGDACGYHRSVMGAAFKEAMPVPGFLIGTTCPCSGGMAIVENLAQHFKKDMFVLNVPQEESEQGVRYLADQIKQMVKFVTDHTGEPLNADRLRNAVELTNQAMGLMKEMFGYTQQVPSPANGHLMGSIGIVLPLMFGTEAAVEIARTYRDFFAERVEKKISGVPDERLRILWIQNRIQFNNPVVEMMEKEYRAAIVSDELNDITWDPIDPDDPYTGMARRAISNPLNGPIKNRIKHLQKLAKEYHINGAVNPCNWGCRQGAGARGLIAEGLKEIGVPVLNLEVDCVDSRNFAEGQMRTRVEAFLEMLL
ncbi:MAG: 2-hydroxyacyl-CoA dehydratase [Desulfobacteraceae bacterium]|nr:2-hydroxyacyl-CoA dehydratase [Desulfobacteraceae bacterium]